MKFKGLFFCFFLLFCLAGYGQMTLHPSDVEPLTPDNLVENVFLGNGIEILNSSFTGSAGSVGLFDNAFEEIGIEKGIVLSTGFAANITKENSSEDPISGNSTGTNYVDRDLEALAQVDVVDIAKFEITFVPSSDVLKFRYVFASEEYPDFVCADKNDVFGFFITGNKPGGGRYQAHNMAVIPDPSDPSMNTFLDLPVTINSVNGGTPGIFSNGGCDDNLESLDFAEYYNEVPVGSVPALNAYLDVFIAQADVIPCETYTIKIVIGDGNDQNEDSVVFLEEKSFSTGTISVNINNPGVDGGLSEGCDPGSLRIMLPSVTSTDFPLEIKALSGSNLIDAAIPGVDFKDIPDVNFIPAGSSYLDLDLMPIDDNIDEGTEYLFISIRKSICKVDTLILPLYNNNLESVTLNDTVFTCFGKEFELEADLGDNINPSSLLTFSNDTPVDIVGSEKHIESTISVFGLKDIALNPKLIAEICIDSLVHTRLNDLDIYLEAPSGQVLELSTDNGARTNNANQQDAFVRTCFHVDASTSINLGESSEGQMDLTNPNYSGTYLPEGDFESWLSPVTSTLNGEYNLFVVDDEQQHEGKLYSWHISFSPKYELDYHWKPNNGISCTDCEIAKGIGEVSQYYYMELIDSYGCTVTDSVWVEVSDQAEEPVVTCESLGSGSLRFTWTESDYSEFYEFKINNSGKWLSTSSGSLVSGFYDIEVIDETTIEISGLLENETLEVAVRGNNAADCRSSASTVSCTSEICGGALPIIDSINIVQPICQSQEKVPVSIYASSSDGPLLYRIFVGTATATNDDGEFSSIPVGTWPIRIIDTNGCALESEVVIIEPPVLEIIPELENITCSNDTDASIHIEVNGDNPPYIFEWNTGEDVPTLTDLPADFYSVTVTDRNDCTSTMDFDILNPAPLMATYIQSENINCNASNNVFASLDIEGGVEPYEVTWNGNTTGDTLLNLERGMITYSVKDANGCSITGGQNVGEDERLSYSFSDIIGVSCPNMADPDGSALISVIYGTAPFNYEWSSGEISDRASGLAIGENFVTITDVDGCSVVGSVDIPAPNSFNVESNIVSPTCNGEEDGSIVLTVTGGVGQIHFFWDTGSLEDRITAMPAGSYRVFIHDDNCIDTSYFEIPQTGELSVLENITKVNCDDDFSGAIDISPEGGSGTYLYSWTGPGNFSSTEQNLTALEVGTYTLILTDEKNPNCKSDPIYIELTIASEIGAIIQTTAEIKCNGNSDAVLTALPSGGESPFNYAWSDGVTSSPRIEGLNAGSYEVTITDSNNCSSVAEKTITEPEALEASSAKNDVSCFNEADGAISIQVMGGVPPYGYNWNNGNIDLNQNLLSAGEYTLTITDDNGCEFTLSEIISQPENGIEISAEVEDVSCAGGSNGSIRISAINGQRPYRYRIEDTPYQSDSVIANLSAGIYMIEIIDANSCIGTSEIEVQEAFPIEVNFMNEMVVNYGSDLQLTIEISNTQGQKSYEWDAPNITDFSCTTCSDPLIKNVTSSFSGMLMIMDSKGCEYEEFYNINVLENGRIDVPTGFSPNGDQVNDVLIVHGDPSLMVNKFEVYSRWGEMVFKAENFHPGDSSMGWNGMHNGTVLSQDSYIWTLECEMESGRLEVLKGQTTLIK